jgi:hypothetical protein
MHLFLVIYSLLDIKSTLKHYWSSGKQFGVTFLSKMTKCRYTDLLTFFVKIWPNQRRITRTVIHTKKLHLSLIRLFDAHVLSKSVEAEMLDMYSGGAQFESWLGHQLSWMGFYSRTSTLSPRKWQNGTSNQDMITSFQTLSNSLFTNHPTI